MTYGLLKGSPLFIPPGWREVRIGGGGLVSGINITASGGTVTKLIRTDACGAYKFNDATQKWDQLVTRDRMPSVDVGASPAAGNKFLNGTFEIVAAPSNPSRIYMAYQPGGGSIGYVYISSDGGLTFTRTSGWSAVTMDGANTETVKQMGPKMAVDPVNPDVVYFGTQHNGAFVTYNAGVNWASVPNVTNSTGGYPAIGFCFDSTSGTTTNTGGSGVRTNIIYLCSNGSGIWHSTNGGTSFSAMAGSPDNAQNCVIAPDGTYYVTTDSAINLAARHVWRFKSATWTDVTPPIGGFDAVYLNVSPFSSNMIVAHHGGGSYTYSTDYGATWDRSGVLTATTNAVDAPWLAVNQAYFALCTAVMDPVAVGKIWVTSGLGIFHTQMPGSGAVPQPVPYTSQVAGHEEIVVNHVLSVPGGPILTVNWDRPVFRVIDPEVYPLTYYPTYVISDQRAIEHAYAIDYASSNPNYVAIISNAAYEDSGYSTNAGLSWNRFGVNQGAVSPAVSPTGAIGGSIAIASQNFQIIAQSNRGDVYYTTDGWATVSTRISAATWNANGATGMVDSNPPARTNETGWTFAVYLRSKRVAADRSATNIFLIFNSNVNASGGGFYKITFPSGVLTIARMGDVPETTSAFNARVKSVPSLAGGASVAGHFFYAGGQGQSTHLWRTTNYGAGSGSTGWTAVQGTGEIYTFGFGAIKPGNDYPGVFVCGVVNGVFGIYHADCSSATWTANSSIPWVQLNLDLPLSSTDVPGDIDGDVNYYGRCFLGYGGMNMVYYKP